MSTTAVSTEWCTLCHPTHIKERYTNIKHIFIEEEEVVEYNSSFYGAVPIYCPTHIIERYTNRDIPI